MIPKINRNYVDSNTEDLYNRCVNRIIWGNDYGLLEKMDEILNLGFVEYEFEPDDFNNDSYNNQTATVRPSKISLINIDVTKLP